MVKGITHILKNNSGVQSLVGMNKVTAKYKVYPVVAGSSEEAPYVIVRQISYVPVAGKCPYNTFTGRVLVFSYDVNFEDCEDLDRAVVDALDGAYGTQNTIRFQQVRFIDTVDGDFDGDRNLFVRISTFEAIVNESIPT